MKKMVCTGEHKLFERKRFWLSLSQHTHKHSSYRGNGKLPNSLKCQLTSGMPWNLLPHRGCAVIAGTV